MDDAPLPIIQTPKEEIKESFEIRQEDKNYILNINIINQEIILNILNKNDLMKEYEINLTFDELKIIHKIFFTFSSSKDFIDFIKTTVEKNKIFIKKNKESQMIIELIVEYLYKQNIIKFELNQKKINFELISQDLYKKFDNISEMYKNLEMNYKKVIEENKKIKEENNKIKEDNIILIQEIQKLNYRICKLEEKINNKDSKNLINNLEVKNNFFNKDLFSLKINNVSNPIDSTIMEKKELDMIYSAIKERMNKEIKEIKKLYQATKDGGDSKTFHKLCDGIPNTLVLYKSEGNRRFGGFVSECWKIEYDAILDKNCFLFSLDKKKIYFPKKKYFIIITNSFDGPSFTDYEGYFIIEIYKNALEHKNLLTNEIHFKDIFGGDENALSEDGNYNGVYAKEYEVFQIIFD